MCDIKCSDILCFAFIPEIIQVYIQDACWLCRGLSGRIFIQSFNLSRFIKLKSISPPYRGFPPVGEV